VAFEAVTFDGWDGGEFGELGAREGGKKPGMFTAKNLMRYRDGLLGPRCGVRNLGVTGLPNGTIKALTAGTSGVAATIGTGTYSFSSTAYGGAATAWTGAAVAGPWTKPGEVAGAFALGYLINPFQAVYRLNHVARTVTAVPAIPAGRCGAFYQDRLFIGGNPTNQARLLFSNPGQAGWETFAADAYLDLPQLVVITFIAPFRSGLLVGGISNWFAYITGTVGFTSVVRFLSVQGAPADTPKGLALGTDEVLYMATDRPYEGSYNGALHSAQKHLRWAGNNYRIDTTETPTYRAVKLIGPDDWLFLCGVTTSLHEADYRALLHYEGGYSYHTWERNIGAWGMDLGGGRVLLAVDGSASSPPVFYVFDPNLGRPGSVLDGDSRPGDDSTTPIDCYLHLPQWFDPNGGEIQVRSITVDFHKWNLSGVANNHFEVNVRACNRYEQPDVLPSAVYTFDEPASAAPFFGIDDRRTSWVGDQGSGAGFEVQIDHIRGCAFRSVTVQYERQPTRDL
jgi:hypothetical protein